VPGFVAAQAAGAILGVALVLALYPAAGPNPGGDPAPAGRETAVAGRETAAAGAAPAAGS
jgi:hypothetical protein